MLLSVAWGRRAALAHARPRARQCGGVPRERPGTWAMLRLPGSAFAPVSACCATQGPRRWTRRAQCCAGSVRVGRSRRSWACVVFVREGSLFESLRKKIGGDRGHVNSWPCGSESRCGACQLVRSGKDDPDDRGKRRVGTSGRKSGAEVSRSGWRCRVGRSTRPADEAGRARLLTSGDARSFPALLQNPSPGRSRGCGSSHPGKGAAAFWGAVIVPDRSTGTCRVATVGDNA